MDGLIGILVIAGYIHSLIHNGNVTIHHFMAEESHGVTLPLLFDTRFACLSGRFHGFNKRSQKTAKVKPIFSRHKSVKVPGVTHDRESQKPCLIMRRIGVPFFLAVMAAARKAFGQQGVVVDFSIQKPI